MIAEIAKSHPDLAFDVVAATSDELLPSLERDELDLAVVHLPLDQPHLNSVVILSDQFNVAMRSDDHLSTATELSLLFG